VGLVWALQRYDDDACSSECSGQRSMDIYSTAADHDQCRELRNVRVLTSLFDIALFLLWKTNDPLKKLLVLTAVFNLPTIYKSINPDAHAVGVMCN
jgi:hypothetical protein